jgi:hypothetical protein
MRLNRKGFLSEMTEGQSSLDFSSYSGRQLAFESVGASVWTALLNLKQSHLAANVLLQSYFEFHANPFSLRNCQSTACQTVLGLYEQLEENAAHLNRKYIQRNSLLGAIGILDSFLSDALRFLFLHEPTAIPGKAPRREAGQSELEHLELVVRRYFSSQKKRIGFLVDRFKIKLTQEVLSDLDRLTHLRNEVAHHGGFYRFIADSTGEIRAEDKPLPSVSHEEATKAWMIVAEVCDSIFVGMSISFFGRSPQVRPITPEMVMHFKHMRGQWAENENKLPVIEEYPDPGWSEKVLDDPNLPWVGDDHYAFLVRPTGIEILPVLMDFLWNKRHGTTALAAVDDYPFQELKDSRELLSRMLTGSSVLVNFYDDRQDEARYARFSLSGFAVAWHTALERKMKSTQ